MMCPAPRGASDSSSKGGLVAWPWPGTGQGQAASEQHGPLLLLLQHNGATRGLWRPWHRPAPRTHTYNRLAGRSRSRCRAVARTWPAALAADTCPKPHPVHHPGMVHCAEMHGAWPASVSPPVTAQRREWARPHPLGTALPMKGMVAADAHTRHPSVTRTRIHCKQFS